MGFLDEARGYSEEDYIVAKNKQEKEVQPRLSGLYREKGALETRIEQLSNQVEELERVKSELERASQYINIYTKIRNELYYRDGTLAMSLRSWALNQLGKKASEYIRRFGIGISQVEFKDKKERCGYYLLR
ncbi:MAG: hypothetical protein QW429_05510 [Thermoprotei archaeon]